MKIRYKDEIIDLAELRKSLSYRSQGRPIMECLGAMRESLIVLDALESALSVPEDYVIDHRSEYDKYGEVGFDYIHSGFEEAIIIVHKAAGLIEENPVA